MSNYAPQIGGVILQCHGQILLTTDTPPIHRRRVLLVSTSKGGLQTALVGGINATFGCCAVDAPRPQGQGITSKSGGALGVFRVIARTPTGRGTKQSLETRAGGQL